MASRSKTFEVVPLHKLNIRLQKQAYGLRLQERLEPAETTENQRFQTAIMNEAIRQGKVARLTGSHWFCAIKRDGRKPVGIAATLELNLLQEEDEQRLKQMLRTERVAPESALYWGQMIVDKNHRSRGIAPMLGEARKQYGLEKGFTHAVAVVGITNAPSIRVMQKHQAKNIGQIDWHGTTSHVFLIDNNAETLKKTR